MKKTWKDGPWTIVLDTAWKQKAAPAILAGSAKKTKKTKKLGRPFGSKNKPK